MDDLTHPMNVIESNQTLSSKSSHEGHWDSLIVISFDNLQEVDTQDFEDHDEMFAVRAVMDERVKKLGAMCTL